VLLLLVLLHELLLLVLLLRGHVVLRLGLAQEGQLLLLARVAAQLRKGLLLWLHVLLRLLRGLPAIAGPALPLAALVASATLTGAVDLQKTLR
jgi:hypothetical protein